jgi:hypothetical protein
MVIPLFTPFSHTVCELYLSQTKLTSLYQLPAPLGQTPEFKLPHSIIFYAITFYDNKTIIEIVFSTYNQIVMCVNNRQHSCLKFFKAFYSTGCSGLSVISGMNTFKGCLRT